MTALATTKGWYSPAELAAHCGCSVDRIEALTRRHHWPRVHGENGGKIGVDLAIAQDALNGTLVTAKGGVLR